MSIAKVYLQAQGFLLSIHTLGETVAILWALLDLPQSMDYLLVVLVVSGPVKRNGMRFTPCNVSTLGT